MAAALVAAGQLSAVGCRPLSSRKVLRTMLLAKMKVALGAVLILVVFGLGALLIQGGSSPASAQAIAERGKAPPTAESLQKEIALLRLNLQVVLEKVHAQESEIAALRKNQDIALSPALMPSIQWLVRRQQELRLLSKAHQKLIADEAHQKLIADAVERAVIYKFSIEQPTERAEAALKALKAAKTPEEKHKATEALQKAVKALTEPAKETK
jgi:hypothetical protein